MFGRTMRRVLLSVVAVAGVLGVAMPVAHAGKAAAPVCPSPTKKSALLPGECLHRNESVMSPNQKFVLIMQTDGNLVLYRRNIWNGKLINAVWATNTAGSNGTEVRFGSNDCKRQGISRVCWGLEVFGTDGKKVWTDALFTIGSTHRMIPFVLAVQDDGHVVAYGQRIQLNAPTRPVVAFWSS